MSRTKSLVLTALFVALIAIGAFIRIPTPLVPITLQFACCLAAAQILGVKGGNSVLIYVVMGLIGLPVFTEGGHVCFKTLVRVPDRYGDGNLYVRFDSKAERR